ncbi:hypothetical protein [Pelagivirga sediminicola]|uniref:hypothetical protein n=1 Tax=Pelagivirga sediminicola TaxID=2170575 RepID=UPI001056E32E|nr:hypothetical protein [Pelagivirga sediminicola]
MRRWIEIGAFVPKVISSAGGFEMGSVNTRQLVPFITHEYERFALSSAESILVANLESDIHGLTGWPLLKMYYSAFFAAHAIMRSQGAGVTKLEKKQAAKINSFLALLGEHDETVTAGMYLYQLDISQRSGPIVTFTPHEPGAGVHESFWNSFCDHLDGHAKTAVRSGTVDATAIVTGSEEVCRAIRGSSSHAGAWLSTMRNQINYQHQHSVWFPLKRRNKVKELLSGLQIQPSKLAKLAASPKTHPVQAFAEATFYLACLNIDVAEVIATRSSKGNAFGPKWKRIRALVKSGH